MWRQYRDEKRTVAQLAQQYGCSTKTILRRLNQVKKQNHFAIHESVNVVMDTTYFGRDFGVMLLLDSMSKQVLSASIVKHETVQLYHQEVQKLIDKGISIQSIICDGCKGLPQIFADYPVQLCQFHQIQTVTRYLTRKPKSQAACELRELALTLTKCDFATFQAALNRWFEQHKSYLNERSHNAETGKSHYTHKRLRSAYFSLKRNLPLLFTFEQYPELVIPKTSNLAESHIARLKDVLRCHRGLNREHKIQFIMDYLSN